MSSYEIFSVTLAGISLLISIIAVFLSGRASIQNKNMFKRQGVIDLHMAWQGVNEIDKNNLIGPDIIKAGNALALTSALWNHDVIEKSILYQTYWEPFRTLYDQLNGIEDLIPGHKKTCKSILTIEIRKAYDGMNKFDLNSVKQTNI